MDAGPLTLFYMARLANLVASLLILAWALRILPTGARPAMFFLLLPTASFLYASLSADGLVIAGTFLFTAVMMKGYFRNRWTAAEITIAIAAALVFCTLKPVYAPLLLLALPAALRSGNRRHVIAVHALICGITLGATVLWLSFASAALVPARPGTSVPDQLAFVLAHPLSFARSVFWSLLGRWRDYYDQLVGVLGWLNLNLPEFAYAIALAGFLFCVTASRTEDRRLPAGVLLWHAALVLTSSLLVMLALYLHWAPVGHFEVIGVQGRYFLPLLAPVALAIGSLPFRASRRVARGSFIALVCTLLSLFLITHITVALAYSRFA
jgi:uncharacterized membrane protein